MRNRKNEELNYENEKIAFEKARLNTPHTITLSTELEQEYNKLLSQK